MDDDGADSSLPGDEDLEGGRLGGARGEMEGHGDLLAQEGVVRSVLVVAALDIEDRSEVAEDALDLVVGAAAAEVDLPAQDLAGPDVGVLQHRVDLDACAECGHQLTEHHRGTPMG